MICHRSLIYKWQICSRSVCVPRATQRHARVRVRVRAWALRLCELCDDCAFIFLFSHFAFLWISYYYYHYFDGAALRLHYAVVNSGGLSINGTGLERVVSSFVLVSLPSLNGLMVTHHIWHFTLACVCLFRRYPPPEWGLISKIRKMCKTRTGNREYRNETGISIYSQLSEGRWCIVISSSNGTHI